jgi:hypothetical protein
MERVATDADVVAFLTGVLGKVFVARNTGGLESASRQLLLLVRHQVGNEGEHIDREPLRTAIEDSDLGVGDTTAEPRFDVRLVLLETNATSWSSSHFAGLVD